MSKKTKVKLIINTDERGARMIKESIESSEIGHGISASSHGGEWFIQVAKIKIDPPLQSSDPLPSIDYYSPKAQRARVREAIASVLDDAARERIPAHTVRVALNQALVQQGAYRHELHPLDTVDETDDDDPEPMPSDASMENAMYGYAGSNLGPVSGPEHPMFEAVGGNAEGYKAAGFTPPVDTVHHYGHHYGYSPVVRDYKINTVGDLIRELRKQNLDSEIEVCTGDGDSQVGSVGHVIGSGSPGFVVIDLGDCNATHG